MRSSLLPIRMGRLLYDLQKVTVDLFLLPKHNKQSVLVDSVKNRGGSSSSFFASCSDALNTASGIDIDSSKQLRSGNREVSFVRSATIPADEYNKIKKRIQRTGKVTSELLSALQSWKEKAVSLELEKKRFNVNTEFLSMGNVTTLSFSSLTLSMKEGGVSKGRTLDEELKYLIIPSAVLPSSTKFYDKASKYGYYFTAEVFMFPSYSFFYNM